MSRPVQRRITGWCNIDPSHLVPGLRVRFKQSVDLSTMTYIPTNSLGVVVRVDPEAKTLGHNLVIAEVLMDRRFTGLKDLDNCVLVHGTRAGDEPWVGPTVEDHLEMAIPKTILSID